MVISVAGPHAIALTVHQRGSVGVLGVVDGGINICLGVGDAVGVPGQAVGVECGRDGLQETLAWMSGLSIGVPVVDGIGVPRGFGLDLMKHLIGQRRR